MVIVIMGVIGGMVAVFMKSPIDAYLDSARRAALTDIADTATRRFARDLRKALPNSVRNPSSQCIEFIPTKTGGRYRADDTANALVIGVADSSFNMLGSNSALPGDQRIVVGDVVAVYNLGVTGADAYAGDNTSPVSAGATLGQSGAPVETTIAIDSKAFPFASPSNRFQVVPGTEKIVAYVCSGGLLLRAANHAYTSSCPTTASGTGTVSVLATNVANCNLVYSGSDLQRNALVQMSITLTDSAGESVNLYHEVHVNNTP
jgi:MSHA biogenesis protein MshO